MKNKGNDNETESCFSCNHMYGGEYCVLRDDLLIGHCFMYTKRK